MREPARGLARSLLVTSAGGARGSEALAGAVATAASEQHRAALLVDLGASERTRRPTLLVGC